MTSAEDVIIIHGAPWATTSLYLERERQRESNTTSHRHYIFISHSLIFTVLCHAFCMYSITHFGTFCNYYMLCFTTMGGAIRCQCCSLDQQCFWQTEWFARDSYLATAPLNGTTVPMHYALHHSTQQHVLHDWFRGWKHIHLLNFELRKQSSLSCKTNTFVEQINDFCFCLMRSKLTQCFIELQNRVLYVCILVLMVFFYLYILVS